MTGFRGAVRGQPAGQEERLRQQHDVIKEGPGVTHSLAHSLTHSPEPQTWEVHKNFNEIPLHKEPINNIFSSKGNKSTART